MTLIPFFCSFLHKTGILELSEENVVQGGFSNFTISLFCSFHIVLKHKHGGFLCQISHSVPLPHPHLFFPIFFFLFFFFFLPLLSLSCLIFIPLSPVSPPWKGTLIVLYQQGVDCPGQPAPSDSHRPLAPIH